MLDFPLKKHFLIKNEVQQQTIFEYARPHTREKSVLIGKKVVSLHPESPPMMAAL